MVGDLGGDPSHRLLQESIPDGMTAGSAHRSLLLRLGVNVPDGITAGSAHRSLRLRVGVNVPDGMTAGSAHRSLRLWLGVNAPDGGFAGAAHGSLRLRPDEGVSDGEFAGFVWTVAGSLIGGLPVGDVGVVGLDGGGNDNRRLRLKRFLLRRRSCAIFCSRVRHGVIVGVVVGGVTVEVGDGSSGGRLGWVVPTGVVVGALVVLFVLSRHGVFVGVVVDGGVVAAIDAGGDVE